MLDSPFAPNRWQPGYGRPCGDLARGSARPEQQARRIAAASILDMVDACGAPTTCGASTGIINADRRPEARHAAWFCPMALRMTRLVRNATLPQASLARSVLQACKFRLGGPARLDSHRRPRHSCGRDPIRPKRPGRGQGRCPVPRRRLDRSLPVVPVLRDVRIHLERHRKCHAALQRITHDPDDMLPNRFRGPGIRLKNQLVVDLKLQPGVPQE